MVCVSHSGKVGRGSSLVRWHTSSGETMIINQDPMKRKQ
jgi:hypothetical protein